MVNDYVRRLASSLPTRRTARGLYRAFVVYSLVTLPVLRRGDLPVQHRRLLTPLLQRVRA